MPPLVEAHVLFWSCGPERNIALSVKLQRGRVGLKTTVHWCRVICPREDQIRWPCSCVAKGKHTGRDTIERPLNAFRHTHTWCTHTLSCWGYTGMRFTRWGYKSLGCSRSSCVSHEELNQRRFDDEYILAAAERWWISSWIMVLWYSAPSPNPRTICQIACLSLQKVKVIIYCVEKEHVLFQHKTKNNIHPVVISVGSTVKTSIFHFKWSICFVNTSLPAVFHFQVFRLRMTTCKGVLYIHNGS